MNRHSPAGEDALPSYADSQQEQRRAAFDAAKTWHSNNWNMPDLRAALETYRLTTKAHKSINRENYEDYLEVSTKSPAEWTRVNPLSWLTQIALTLDAKRAADAQRAREAAMPNPYSEQAAGRGNGPERRWHQPPAYIHAANPTATNTRRV
ncbi:hypothetical protein [Micromonospora sp. WMMD710]|uniref:hypothetical protein n=1 Tax=Micromonospora sp. WMMD710 TaxID=3016085 RepID=UPI0024166349|nr:hypothetical protein [Micromonospora sp. WMMD710]MDG4761283.1 hypothetical protein [Micromonospora sp. WMMD710]